MKIEQSKTIYCRKNKKGKFIESSQGFADLLHISSPQLLYNKDDLDLVNMTSAQMTQYTFNPLIRIEEYSLQLLISHGLIFDNKFNLTPRQIQCIELVGQGLTSKTIAYQLNISTRTVEKHIENAKSILGISKTVELIRVICTNSNNK